MDRQQIALIVGSIALAALLFFGFDTKPPGQSAVEKSRAGNVEIQKTLNVLREAKAALPEDARKYMQGLENVAEGTDDDSIRLVALEQLSSMWYEKGEYIPAGYYAEQIADRMQSAESWSIAGATYGAGFKGDSEALAVDGAVRCFENAISIDPENTEYRINLAICYAEHPPADNPMKGIQLLLELNRNHPENTAVLFHLARFGMQTGQYDKARERLTQAIELNPADGRLYCLMANVMEQLNVADSVEYYRAQCSSPPQADRKDKGARD